MKFWQHVKVVLWAFIGLGRRKHATELGRTNPLLFIAVAFVLVLLFLAGLMAIVHNVVT
jgi:hypothetical protein